MLCCAIHRFDSILVRLKDHSATLVGVRLACFDSILVRLKAYHQAYDPADALGFDSILVRLKASKDEVGMLLAPSFRFHTGSIKSCYFRDYL